jgi:hypothetical protein
MLRGCETGKPAKTGALKSVRAWCRHYGVQTEIASLFATFGILSRHKYSDEPQPTSSRDHAEHSQLSRFMVDG